MTGNYAKIRNFGDKIVEAKLRQIKMFFLQIFDSESEHVWALLVRQYFKLNNLDLSASIKCPELCTCTKKPDFPIFYIKTFKLWDELIESWTL